MSRTTRPACQTAVRDVLESGEIEFHVQYNTIVAMMNRLAKEGNDDFGQLRTFLTPLGEDTDAYRGAVGAYMRTMADTGNHNRALRAAAEFADLEAPSEDLGPIDRVFNAVQSRLDRPNGNGAIARAGGFVRRHAKPRRPERHSPEHN